MDVFEARKQNAIKVCKKIDALLEQGWRIETLYDGIRTEPHTYTDEGIYWIPKPTDKNRITYMVFEYDKELDHGMHTKIADFNEEVVSEMVSFIPPAETTSPKTILGL